MTNKGKTDSDICLKFCLNLVINNKANTREFSHYMSNARPILPIRA